MEIVGYLGRGVDRHLGAAGTRPRHRHHRVLLEGQVGVAAVEEGVFEGDLGLAETRRDVAEGKLKRVANSPFTIVLDPKKKKHYLDGGIEWYVADSVEGPWQVTQKPPKKIRALRSDKAQRTARSRNSSLPVNSYP